MTTNGSNMPKGYINGLVRRDIYGYDAAGNILGIIETEVGSSKDKKKNKAARKELKELGAVRIKAKNVWEFIPVD